MLLLNILGNVTAGTLKEIHGEVGMFGIKVLRIQIVKQSLVSW
jgi:hypothetical protein